MTSISMNGLTPEQDVLLKAAMHAWELLDDAKAFDSPLGEETLTELTLLWLKKNLSRKTLSIVSFNKFREGETGADWAWAFVNHDMTSVVAMLVQAKILNASGKRYDELNRNIGKTQVRQIDRLLSTAASWRWPAIYAFYNHPNGGTVFPSSCQTFGRANVGVPESWGISFADAYSVRQMLDADDPPDISSATHINISLPLHCLLCSRASGEEPGGGIPEAVLRGLSVLYRRTFGFERHGAPGYAIPDQPLQELPALFVEALRIHQVKEDARNDEIAYLQDKYPNIAGVLVIQDQEHDQTGE